MNEKLTDLTPKHEALYNILGEGKENGLSKKVLVLRTGYPERKIRKLIEELNAAGLVVCNMQDGAGYYKPSTVEDYEAMINIETSRADALREKIYGIKLGMYEYLRKNEPAYAELRVENAVREQ